MSLLSTTLKGSKFAGFKTGRINEAVKASVRHLAAVPTPEPKVPTPRAIVSEPVITETTRQRSFAEQYDFDNKLDLSLVREDINRQLSQIPRSRGNELDRRVAQLEELKQREKELNELIPSPFASKSEQDLAKSRNPFAEPTLADVEGDFRADEIVLPENHNTNFFSNAEVENFIDNASVELIDNTPITHIPTRFIYEQPIDTSPEAMARKKVRAEMPLSPDGEYYRSPEKPIAITPSVDANASETDIIKARIDNLVKKSENPEISVHDYEILAREVNRLEAKLTPQATVMQKLGDEDSGKLPLFSVLKLNELAGRTGVDDPRLRPRPFIEFAEGVAPTPVKNKPGLGNTLDEGPTLVEQKTLVDEPTQVDVELPKQMAKEYEIQDGEYEVVNDLAKAEDDGLEMVDNSMLEDFVEEAPVVVNTTPQPEPMKVPPTLTIASKNPKPQEIDPRRRENTLVTWAKNILGRGKKDHPSTTTETTQTKYKQAG